MDLYPRSFGEGLEARMTGPGKGRFVLQPPAHVPSYIQGTTRDGSTIDLFPWIPETYFKALLGALGTLSTS